LADRNASRKTVHVWAIERKITSSAFRANPVSAFVTFLLLVRPAILKMQGAKKCGHPMIEGELTESVVNRGDRRHFVRVRLQDGKIYPAGGQKSHMIGSLSLTNALLDVAPGAELKTGSRAKRYSLGPARSLKFPDRKGFGRMARAPHSNALAQPGPVMARKRHTALGAANEGISLKLRALMSERLPKDVGHHL
jgi:hypothetical protein